MHPHAKLLAYHRAAEDQFDDWEEWENVFLEVWTDGLLSKWGFNDGDILDNLVDAYCEERDIDWKVCDCHNIFQKLLTRYVLPKIQPKVEVEFLVTNHNPARAKTINGLKCTCYWHEPMLGWGILEPEVVYVPLKKVRAEIRSYFE